MTQLFITISTWAAVIIILLSCDKSVRPETKTEVSDVALPAAIKAERDLSVPLGSFSSKKYTAKITKTGEQFRLQTTWKEEHKKKFLKELPKRERSVSKRFRFTEEDFTTQFDCLFNAELEHEDNVRRASCIEDGEQKQESPYYIFFETKDGTVEIGINDGNAEPFNAIFNLHGYFK